MEYNYTTLAAAMLSWPEDGDPDPQYLAEVPNLIAFGEDRLLGELNLENLESELDADIEDGNDEIVKPDGIIALRAIGYLHSGIYTQLQLMTPDFVRRYAAEAAAGSPKYICERSETVWGIAPVPNFDVDCDLRATANPPGLDSSTPTITTWLSRTVPQLLLQSCLLGAHLYLKNDPKWASVKANYDLLMPDAKARMAQLRKSVPDDQIVKRMTIRPENADAQPQNQ